MDFSSLNPLSSNRLNLAARNNDVKKVEKLLKKMNPNCVDNRGWTCLHEAAARDSYQSMLLILKHKNIRPLAETHEGHTALYLACRDMSSVQTIRALLQSVPDIANYGNTENVTPLHVASAQGRVEIVQLLIEYGAMPDVQDFDGDTPLHDAVLSNRHEAVNMLLYLGADPEIRNDAEYTPFHLACYKGCFKTVQIIYPFVNDINQVTLNGDTPLILASHGCSDDIVKFLLKNGADPHIKNKNGDLALAMALKLGHSSIFKILLSVTCSSKIDPKIILYACKTHFFKMEILETLLTHDLGPEFFDFYEMFYTTLESIDGYPIYLTNAPINSYLKICEYIYNRFPVKFKEFFYLFLMRGLMVDAIAVNECPPLVFIHHCTHTLCFEEVFHILREHGCNIDYTSMPFCCKQDRYLPDAFIASLTSDPATLLVMLPHSLYCDPEYLLRFACASNFLERIPYYVQYQLMSMIGVTDHTLPPESLPYTVFPLNHLCRQRIRLSIRSSSKNSLITTKQFYDILNRLEIPLILKNFLRFG